MQKLKLLLLSSCCFFIQQLWGIPALDSYQHVVPARIHNAGTVSLSAYYSTFKKHHVFNSHGSPSGLVLWDTHSMLGLYYSATSHIEIGLIPTIFQHNHQSDNLDFPSQIHALAKLGSYTFADSTFMFGMQVSSRVPFHKRNNMPMQSYSTKRIGFGLAGMLSFLPAFFDSWQIHSNIGLYDHNDTDLVLTDNPEDSLVNEKSSKELFYGLSIEKRWQRFAVYTELYGSVFLQKPPLSAYTRENNLYINPGLAYQFNNWIGLTFGLDVLILGQQDKTLYEGNGGYADQKWRKLPNLPTWRFNAGLNFVIYSPPRQKQKISNEAERPIEVFEEEADSFSVSREEFIEKLRNNQKEDQEEFIKQYEKVLEDDRERRKEIMQKLQKRLEEQQRQASPEEDRDK